MGDHKTRYSAEVRERAARPILNHQGEHGSEWAAIGSIASKIGGHAGGASVLGPAGRTGRRSATGSHEGKARAD